MDLYEHRVLTALSQVHWRRFSEGNRMASIENMSIDQLGEDAVASAQLGIGGVAFDAYFQIRNYRADRLTGLAEAFLTVALMASMRRGETLKIDQPVSPLLLSGIDAIQDIWTDWHSQLSHIGIETQPRTEATDIPQAGPGVGMFFSGGVDSLYTFMKWAKNKRDPSQQRLTHIVFLLGFDPGTTFKGDDADAGDRRLESALKSARRVASNHDVEMIIVESNIRQFTDQFEGWAHYHGSVLAATAQLLGGTIGTFAIASTEQYRDLAPWGTHALTDHLWSTEFVKLLHDGAEHSRSGKIDALVEGFPEALDDLRVCWNDESSEFNCCKCQKCLQTMIRLRLRGALADCQAFTYPLDLEAVREADFKRPNLLREWRRQLVDVAEIEGESDLYKAMVKAIEHGEQQERDMGVHD